MASTVKISVLLLFICFLDVHAFVSTPIKEARHTTFLSTSSSSTSSSSSSFLLRMKNDDGDDDDDNRTDYENDIQSLRCLVKASSLSYLTIEKIKSSPYYDDDDDDDSGTLNPIVQVIDPISESGATIFITNVKAKNIDERCDRRRIVVACRGSATPKNFVTNATIRKERHRCLRDIPPNTAACSVIKKANNLNRLPRFLLWPSKNSLLSWILWSRRNALDDSSESMPNPVT